jgi:hypothetical protein
VENFFAMPKSPNSGAPKFCKMAQTRRPFTNKFNGLDGSGAGVSDVPRSLLDTHRAVKTMYLLTLQSGRREAAELLRRMLKAKVSRFHPDPMVAVEAAEVARKRCSR